MIEGIDSVIVYVSDLEKSLSWYQEVLGLRLRSRHGHFAVFDLHPATLALHQADPNKGLQGSMGSMPVLLVEEYDQAKELLSQRGCQFIYENRLPHADFGTFLDPDQNPIQIVERH